MLGFPVSREAGARGTATRPKAGRGGGTNGLPRSEREGIGARAGLSLFLLILLAACTAPPTYPRDVVFADLPGWAADRHAEAIPPLLATCRTIAGLPPDRPLGGTGATQVTPAALAPACTEAATLPPGDAAARAFLERRFRPVALGEGTLTGYFEPELRGSPTRTARFATPLHARPPELVEADLGTHIAELRGRRIAGVVREGRLHPFPDRAAILAGALDARGLELAWVDDPADAFFLQVQGSGRVRFEDGRVLRLGYAGWNGHPYVAIGRFLVESGALPRERVSMQSIRAWMTQAGPAEAAALMARNPSYVFFRVLDLPPEQGPVGTLGAPLTPMRSVAVDRTHVPLGLPVWVSGRDPLDGAPLRRLTLAQDTGGAIRGLARADLFTGWGEQAAERAGRMRDPAALFVLLPR
ncbi:murein transglycosylase A [Falsiroseomonas oryzae]|uniref:murein transglycosylase A n=1 Tax=Falsiroseomonas oryzae TaxID=2766473 RepID=UPI0022EA7103|nr:MltA domain-containing protein [Roseomonas sp. MO-31]